MSAHGRNLGRLNPTRKPVEKRVMRALSESFLFAALAALGPALALPSGAQADDSTAACAVHDRERGECSVGTQAPSREAMLNTIQSGSPTKLLSTLEYGEHVECDACVRPLLTRILTDDNARVREFAAWWIRKRPFHAGFAMKSLRTTLASDADELRRARAAEAIGEFMDPNGLAHLEAAFEEEESATVRRAAVLALGRLNHPGGRTALASALADADAGVRRAALESIRRVNFFTQSEPILEALGDADPAVRRDAAQWLGQFRVTDAREVLTSLLTSDPDERVRQSAAWALGRVGGAKNALTAAFEKETSKPVRDAIEVALFM